MKSLDIVNINIIFRKNTNIDDIGLNRGLIKDQIF